MYLKSFLTACAVFAAAFSFGQTNSYSGSTGGNWNTNTNWSLGTVPVAADSVVIPNGINLNVNTNAVCRSLTILGGGSDNDIIIGGSNSLTISNALTINAPSSANVTKEVSVNAGSLSCAKLIMANTSNNNRKCLITITSGSMLVSGDVTMPGSSSRNAISITSNGKLSIGGDLGSSGGVTASNSSTVSYTGNSSQNIRTMNYAKLILSGSSTKTMLGDFTVSDSLIIRSGTTLDIVDHQLSLSSAVLEVSGTLDFTDANGYAQNSSGTSVLSVKAGALIRTADNSGLGPAANASLINNGTTFTTSSIANNGTVEYYRSTSSNQTVTDINYNNLIISGNTRTKTWTLGGARTVNGNITINSNAPFTFGGTQNLNLKGNWTNNSTATFTPGNVSIYFNGTSAQTIGGSQGTTFNNIIIANSNGITLNAAVNVSSTGVLTLTSGAVTTTNTYLLSINNTATTAISGGSNTAFINGPLVRSVTGTTGTWTFPVGKTSYAMASAFIRNPTAAASFKFELKRGDASTIFGTQMGTGVTQVSACEYWDLSRVSGTGNGTVGLSWSPASGCSGGVYIDDSSKLVIAHWTDYNQPGNYRWYSEGVSAVTGNRSAGTIASSGTVVSGYSPFAVASSNIGYNPLPLHLLSFSSKRLSGSDIALQWRTSSESAVSHFEIERSRDGINYQSIGQVSAKNTVLNDYVFSNSSIIQEHNYRLKMVDLNGSYTYSGTVYIAAKTAVEKLMLFPNPASTVLNVSSSYEANLAYSIHDVMGAVVINGELTPGTSSINIENLGTGMYWFRSNDGQILKFSKVNN